MLWNVIRGGDKNMHKEEEKIENKKTHLYAVSILCALWYNSAVMHFFNILFHLKNS